MPSARSTMRRSLHGAVTAVRHLARGPGRVAGGSAEDSALLQGMVDGSPVGLALLDRDLRFRTVNEALAALNGMPREAHLGRTPMELLPGVPPESYLQDFRDVMEGRSPLRRKEISGETPAHPGVLRHWEESFFPVRSPRGDIRGLGIVAVEVTESRAAAVALRESEATLRLILDSAPNGILLVDGQGNVRALNPECARLFGYDVEELVGCPVEVLLPLEMRPEHVALRQDFIHDASNRLLGHDRELRGLRQDGSEFPVEIALAVASGAPGLVTAVVTDISERKRAESERAALLGAERAAADRLARLQLVTEAGLAQLPMPDLLRELVMRVVEAVGADAAAILLLDEEGAHLRVASHVGLDDAEAETVRLPIGDGVAGLVARDARPRVVSDLQDSPAHDAAALRGLRSMISVPLVVEGALIGVLEVTARETDRFRPEDLDLLQPLGDRVALAVDRARAFDRERDIAETLQRSLLPDQLPTLARASLAVRYMPGAAGTRVGGDWYDVQQLSDGCVVLVIGDVMGRGVRAASVMGQLRAALRIYVGMDLPLPEIAERINATVLAMGEDEMATMLILRLSPRTGELRWVSAGHLPAVVRAPDGTSRLLDTDAGSGIALGATPAARYTEASDAIVPGSTLLLYTDGLVERPDASLLDALSELLAAAGQAPSDAEACCDDLIARFLPSARSSDDVALLALHLTEVPVAPLDLPLPGTAEGLSRARARLRSWLALAGASEDETLDVLLAVGEALARSPMEDVDADDNGSPAYAPRGVLTVDLVGDRVEVVLRGASSAGPPDGTDRGRGLVLMEAVVHELSISHERTGQPEELRLVRRLANPATAPAG